mmetsp:Transcript_11998/g.51654  ORF Transcript_11998/g.51654 Transcript_11998/m.51654 type:complete len:220 (+) Transcript_11998:158-817(+)
MHVVVHGVPAGAERPQQNQTPAARQVRHEVRPRVVRPKRPRRPEPPTPERLREQRQRQRPRHGVSPPPDRERRRERKLQQEPVVVVAVSVRASEGSRAGVGRWREERKVPRDDPLDLREPDEEEERGHRASSGEERGGFPRAERVLPPSRRISVVVVKRVVRRQRRERIARVAPVPPLRAPSPVLREVRHEQARAPEHSDLLHRQLVQRASSHHEDVEE